MAKATVHTQDEDFDSDRETISSHQKQALKALKDQITRFTAKDSAVQVKNLRDKRLCANFPPIIHFAELPVKSKQVKPTQEEPSRELKHVESQVKEADRLNAESIAFNVIHHPRLRAEAGSTCFNSFARLAQKRLK